MATIYNTELFRELKEGAKLQQLNDVVPSQLADKVVPVMEVNPKLIRRTNILVNANKLTTGSATVYTTPTDKEFVLLGVQSSIIKDVACDVATGQIRTVATSDEGIAVYPTALAVIALTVQNQSIFVSFGNGIKLKKGTVISHGATFTAGVMSITTVIIGYVVENVNA